MVGARGQGRGAGSRDGGRGLWQRVVMKKAYELRWPRHGRSVISTFRDPQWCVGSLDGFVLSFVD